MPYPPDCRINRYIMECKSFDDLDTGWDRCGINRYIMECKWKAGHKGTYAWF